MRGYDGPMGAATRFPHLLSPGRIGGLHLRNRIVLTPMGTNLEAEDGTPGPRITRFYEERARGGVGLVVVGVTGIAWPSGVSNPNNMGLSEDRFIPAFRELTDRIHDQGAAVAVQLQHAGRVALQDVAAGRARALVLAARSRIRLGAFAGGRKDGVARAQQQLDPRAVHLVERL